MVTEDELYVGMRVALPYGIRGVVVRTSKTEGEVSAVVAPDDEATGNCTCGCEECCGPVYWRYRLDELRPA